MLAPAHEALLSTTRVEFEWTQVVEENFDRYELWVDGSLKKTLRTIVETSATLLVTEGTHWWYIVAYDQAGNRARTDTWNFTVSLVERSVEIELLDPEKNVTPGTEVVYQVKITNTGAAADNFQILVETDLGWEVAVQPSAVALKPGESTIVMVVVQVPEEAEPGTTVGISVSAQSLSAVAVTDSSGIDVNVQLPEEVGVPLSLLLLLLAPLAGIGAWWVTRQRLTFPRPVRRVRPRRYPRKKAKRAKKARRPKPTRGRAKRPAPRRVRARRPAARKPPAKPKWEEEPEFLEHLKKRVLQEKRE